MIVITLLHLEYRDMLYLFWGFTDPLIGAPLSLIFFFGLAANMKSSAGSTKGIQGSPKKEIGFLSTLSLSPD
jgi:hypothetical protein